MLKGRQSARAQNSQISVNYDLCYSCGACVAVCPPDALFLHGLHLQVDHETCTRCNRCVVMCPVHALALQPTRDHRYEKRL